MILVNGSVFFVTCKFVRDLTFLKDVLNDFCRKICLFYSNKERFRFYVFRIL
jgi:hypothetical protein